ncbi:uncharacterized protein LOC109074595 [Cyprinus carpio]|uniref:Uncharacterized protein LOC109074595 n=1 Tax=Cyprinus carpio TaxID=7962 RepID=A0A9Q9ZUJ8_CYPCA|nr:uncharacterized protein LOC109074595 [Cyprinus carpio]
MTELRAEDAGKYWCAVRDVFNLPLEFVIIMKDAVIHEASVGGSASISCKHIRKQTQKFFCRGDQPSICIRDGARVSSNNRINGRFSLTEETSAGVFTVKISDLRVEYSGKYWCGEEISGSFIFTEVQLHLTREMTTSNTKRETSQEKAEMTSSDTKKETVQETENPGFFVIAVVSVGLLLLALVIALILFKLKHNKHGIISSTDRRQTGDHETTQEDIQDTRHLDPESDPLYSTVELPTNPSDSQNPLYSAVQLPTIPSDSQNPLYSAVQLPTIPSDGLLYAAVSFQKCEESLSEATVRFSKEETQCDYASVNHNTSPN